MRKRSTLANDVWFSFSMSSYSNRMSFYEMQLKDMKGSAGRKLASICFLFKFWP